MADPRIIHIELDEATILWRNADIEQERRIAIFDLIEENLFKPCRAAEAGHLGPYRLKLGVEDGRLSLDIADENGGQLETLILGLGRFRRPIREYFAICDSYYQAIRKASAQRSRPSTWPAAASTTKLPRCCWNGWRARLKPISPPPGGCSP
jgi:uncharacterized protein (UPF0262 family)